jgi:competence ComEA-like helix-hairpin-helix protein
MRKPWSTKRDHLPAPNLLFVVWLLISLFLPFPPHITAEELTGQVNINTATAEELQQLPFIGANRAKAIIGYRERHGDFTSLAILIDSSIIGQKTYEAISPYLTLTGPTRLHYIGKSEAGDRVISTHNFRNLVLTRPGEVRPLADSEYYEVLTAVINNARERIDLAMFLFKTTDSPRNRPAKLLDRLIAAHRRGVEVRVFLENSGYDEGINEENRKVANRLRKHGIAVVFDSPRTTSHVKMVVVDRRYLIVGSHNLTHSALADNREFSLLVDNQDLARQAMAYLQSLPHR